VTFKEIRKDGHPKGIDKNPMIFSTKSHIYKLNTESDKSKISFAAVGNLTSWTNRDIDIPKEDKLRSIRYSFVEHEGFMYAFSHSLAFQSSKLAVYRIDLKKLTWESVKVSGVSIPERRTDFSIVLYGNSVYLFGGYIQGGIRTSVKGGDRWKNEFYRFDLDSHSWNVVEYKGVPPPKRSGHSAISYHDSMYIFGGAFDSFEKNDLIKFSFTDEKWSIMKPLGVCPSAREKHQFGLLRNYMIVFSSHDLVSARDIHALNLDTLIWNKVDIDIPDGYKICLNRDLVKKDTSLIGFQQMEEQKVNIYEFSL
jgi:hypothetical protein